MGSQCGAFRTCLAALIAIQHGCIPSAMAAAGAHAVKVGHHKHYPCFFIPFPFIPLSKLPMSVFYITFSIMFSGLTTAACKLKWNMIVLKVLPSLVKDAFTCKWRRCFKQDRLIRRRCERNTGSITLYGTVRKDGKRPAAKWD